jgi:serine/threonine protein kinase
MEPVADLQKEWEQVFKKYAFIKKLGQGSFGTVIKAKNILTGQKVAIKLIKGFDHQYSVRKVFREIKLMRKLSEIENNIFTTKVIDVILPENLQNVT